MLSPLVWGNTTDLLELELEAVLSRSSRFDAARRHIYKEAKSRADKPKFVTALMKLCASKGCSISYILNPLRNPESTASIFLREKIIWSKFPDAISVGVGGQLPNDRVRRKEEQLNNIMSCTVPFLLPNTKVVDFCCGCGHQSIPLAYLFPQCSFVLVDMNETSLDIAEERCKSAGLSNVSFVRSRIEDFHEPFDVGISLHACGTASDITQRACIQHGAVYVSIPCCVGKVNLSTTLIGARSDRIRNIISRDEYECIAKAGDFGHGYDTAVGEAASTITESYIKHPHNSQRRSFDAEDEPNAETYSITDNRRLAKCFLERDRNMMAEESGYATWMMECWPPSCTPKNDIIIGFPSSDSERFRIFEEWAFAILPSSLTSH